LDVNLATNQAKHRPKINGILYDHGGNGVDPTHDPGLEAARVPDFGY